MSGKGRKEVQKIQTFYDVTHYKTYIKIRLNFYLSTIKQDWYKVCIT